MSALDVIWGVVVIGAGVFIAVYGNMLFRFALAALGFGAGFLAAIRLLEDQDQGIRILLALAIGGIAAVLLFTLVKFSLYIAGGMLGLVAGLVLIGVIDILGPKPDGLIASVIGAAGIGLGAFFGQRLGNTVVLLASAAGGSFLIVNGVQVLFESRLATDIADPTETVSQKLTLTIFVIFFAVSVLSQYNYRQFRQRVLH